MRYTILECALGTVTLIDARTIQSDTPELGIFVAIVFDDDSAYYGMNSNPLPGGRFTAREFLEVYLNAAKWALVYLDCKNTQETMGTWHFTPEAIELAKRALEGWGRK